MVAANNNVRESFKFKKWVHSLTNDAVRQPNLLQLSRSQQSVWLVADLPGRTFHPYCIVC